MIVTASHGDTVVILDTDDQNYGGPDIADDLCRRASVTLVATVVQLIAETATAD